MDRFLYYKGHNHNIHYYVFECKYGYYEIEAENNNITICDEVEKDSLNNLDPMPSLYVGFLLEIEKQVNIYNRGKKLKQILDEN
jgi:hypothetical protein